MKRFLLVLVPVLFLTLASSASAQASCPTGVNHCSNLTWTAGGGGGAATSFNVYRTLTSGGCSTVTGASCLKAGTSTSASFTDQTLVGSTTYFWVVTAVNSVGESAPSNQVTGTTGPDAPSAPTNLQVTVK